MSDEIPAALAAWLAEHVPGVEDVRWRRVGEGHSNHTYLLESAGDPMILRRPPEASIHASAHAMDREYRLLRALADTAVPSPTPIALCDDVDVLGAPFLLMEHVPGHCLKDRLPPEAPPQPDAAAQIGAALVDALAEVQAIPWREAGLGDFGRPEGFLERQVARWTKQYEAIQVRDLAAFAEVAAWLEANRPPATEPGIVHGDYHADNTLISFAGGTRIEAVLDWEMATIGDPLLDLGLLLAFWGTDGRPARRAFHDVQAFSHVGGAPSRADLAARYERLSGRSVAHLDYYMVLALWKLAAICEGAYANYLAQKTTAAHARGMEQEVPLLLEEASLHARAGPAARGSAR